MVVEGLETGLTFYVFSWLLGAAPDPAPRLGGGNALLFGFGF